MTAWKWGELNGLLLPFICSQIATMFLRNDEGKRDEICWGENKSGSFTVKSAYMLSLIHLRLQMGYGTGWGSLQFLKD